MIEAQSSRGERAPDEALTGPMTVLYASRYVEYHAGVYPLGDSAANILVGARTRLATPFGRGGPVQPLSRGECWFFSRVYIGSTPTSLRAELQH
jgi:hypothetical protein